MNWLVLPLALRSLAFADFSRGIGTAKCEEAASGNKENTFGMPGIAEFVFEFIPNVLDILEQTFYSANNFLPLLCLKIYIGTSSTILCNLSQISIKEEYSHRSPDRSLAMGPCVVISRIS